ncbi:DegT/DnrJ/EryC1/StrS aminotransferase family protein [Methyloceanibacter sp. wino2]|uniref:DegT/DnrJ/EryC1/StrS family aminotransferase n=1 Tax=Methyloceanibacter sp. wino2 TaxID=2170729 RepID=UPI000D3E2EDA|nr:DegT/DnrJ/EryC1/StrS family aminotransferase [Methyloceanibacter sp. wino2]
MEAAGPDIPFFRLDLDDEDIASVVSVLRGGWLTAGPQVAAFEDEFEQFMGEGVRAVAVASNTAGMHLALEALGIAQGDEVIVPTLTFTATAEVVRALGADVVFVDIDPQTLCIDPDKIAEAITPRTRAIMPVHFGGLPCDMGRIYALAEPHGIHVVDDAAHALPASIDGVHVGAGASDAAVFSFYANKTITTGEGGMIVSRNESLIERCKLTRFHGIDRDSFDRSAPDLAKLCYDVVAPGFKYNMNDMAASLGRTQLSRAHDFHTRRQHIAARYHDGVAGLPLTLPAWPKSHQTHSWHLYPIQFHDRAARDRFLEHLSRHGVGFSIHYRPLHQMTYWRERNNLRDDQFPVATRYAERCVSLPIFASMRDDEIARVIDVVQAAFH